MNDSWVVLGVLALLFALAAGQGVTTPNATSTNTTNSTLNATHFPSPTFIPGWCSGCSQTQGIYVAVFIALLGTGVLLAVMFALWGAWRGRQLRDAEMYNHVEEETVMGKMVSLEMGELTRKRGNDDYF